MINLYLDVTWNLSVTSRNHKNNSIQNPVQYSGLVMLMTMKKSAAAQSKQNISTNTHPIAARLELLCCHPCRGLIDPPRTVSPFVFL